MKIRSSLWLVVSALAVPCLRNSGAAQQPSTDHPMTTIKVQSNEVLLPVTVIDKKGALVTTLKASDFTLTEDGRPQVIKSFTTQSNLPFRLGLLVDTSRSVYSAMDNERKAADKFVDQMIPADPKAGVQGDQAFLIHFDHEVELLEDFTNSRDKLHHEIDAMSPTSSERNYQQGPESSGDDRKQGQSHDSHFGGTQLYDAIYLASDELMKPKDGRKALVVFSDGQDRGSKETLNDAIDAADRASLEVFTIYFKGEEERPMGQFPGGHRGGMGGVAIPAGAAIRAAVAIQEAVVAAEIAAMIPASTARRSCSKSPLAPVDNFSRPRKKTTSTRSTVSSPARFASSTCSLTRPTKPTPKTSSTRSR